MDSVNFSVPVIIFVALTSIAILIAYPTSFGAYFSRCFRIKFTYGMLISLLPVFAFLLIAMVPSLFPLIYVVAPISCIILVTAVYRQMRGKCRLSNLKN